MDKHGRPGQHPYTELGGGVRPTQGPMTSSQLEAFREASQQAVARFEDSGRKLREENLPDVARIFEHLADPGNLRGIGLVAAAICRKLGLPRRKTLDHVQRVFGSSLAEMLKEELLEIGLKLRARGFGVKEIPQLLGMSYSTFKKLCRAKLGRTPGTLSAGSAAGLKGPWDRFFAGELTTEETGAVRELIGRRYPEMLRPAPADERWPEPRTGASEAGADEPTLFLRRSAETGEMTARQLPAGMNPGDPPPGVFHSPEQARDLCAAPILARIREERAAAHAEVRVLLEYVEKHFWDFDLVDVVTRRVGRRRRLRDDFGKTFGCPPATYVRDRRMEVAFALLRETSLGVSEIGRVLGYDTAQKFNFAFKSCSGGLGPVEWRRRAVAEGPLAGLLQADLMLWRRAMATPWRRPARRGRRNPSRKAGGVSAPVGVALLTHTLKVSPRWWLETAGAEPAQGEAAEPPSDELAYEVFKAAAVWKEAERKPPSLRKAAVRYPVPMGSLLLFELLSDMARGCHDAAAARELAELARCSLDACVGPAAARLPDARGLAWVRLGRLALMDDEEAAAERALGFADVECAAGSEPSVGARRLEAKAELAFEQGRHDAAAELAERAADAYAGLGEHDSVARCLLLREKARGGPRCLASPAAEELERVIEALGTAPPPEVIESLRAELAMAYVRSRAFEKAKRVIGRLERARAARDPG